MTQILAEPASVYRQRSFERAARRYDDVSEVQRQMARRLACLLGERGSGGAQALELGCGTGHLSAELLERLHAGELLLTDVAPAMLERARQRVVACGRPVTWRVLDCRAGWTLGRSFDLVASNALVQWFGDLAAHFRAVHGHLRRDGGYLVSGFLDDNLPELGELLDEFAVPRVAGHSLDEVVAAASASGLEVDLLEADELRVSYHSPRSFFDSLRAMGASRYPGSSPLRRRALFELEETYARRHRRAGGVCASWRPWYALLRKGATPAAPDETSRGQAGLRGP